MALRLVYATVRMDDLGKIKEARLARRNPMRALLLMTLAACHTDPPVTDLDAGLTRDSGVTGNGTGTGTATGPCYFLDTATRCAPKCANRTLGRPTFGAGCEIGPGIYCKQENMTGIAGEGGQCCWETEQKTVELYPCT